MKIGLCIPTFNASKVLVNFLAALQDVQALFERILVIDSSSADSTVQQFKAAGFPVKVIPGIEFDHGGTRQMAVDMFSDCEIILFLTQDAVPTSKECICRLLAVFEDPSIAIAYGRQLPRPEAGPIEAHARLFGYPTQSRIKSKDSISEIGLRAAVVSNSFAAYRRSTLLELGGFPKGTLFGEDTLTGAKAILADYKIAYVGDAEVYHSHDYTLLQEFRRYFDNGAFYSREKWILEAFGNAEGSGKAYVLSEMKHLLKSSPWLLPLSAITVFVKYFGYRAGAMERYFPARWKLHLSMNKAFWRREIAAGK
jgi:rhamnosyltransferase